MSKNPFLKYVEATVRQDENYSYLRAGTPSLAAEYADVKLQPQYANKTLNEHTGDTAVDATKAAMTLAQTGISALDLGAYVVDAAVKAPYRLAQTLAPDELEPAYTTEYGQFSKLLNDNLGFNIGKAKQTLGELGYSDIRKAQEQELYTGYTQEQIAAFNSDWANQYNIQYQDLANKGANALQLEGFKAKFNDNYKKAYTDFIGKNQTSWDKSLGENLSIMGKAFGTVLDNPALAAGAAIESTGYLAPSLLVSRGVAALQGAARAATTTGRAVAAGTGEGLVSALALNEQMRGNSETGTIDGTKVAAGFGGGALTGLIGGVSNRLGSKFGADDIDSLILGTQAKGFSVTRPVLATAQEGGEEFLQSFGESIIPNIAEGNDPLQGLAQEVALGTVAGGIMGGATNARSLVSGAGSDLVAGFNKVAEAVGKGKDAITAKTFEEFNDPTNKGYDPTKAFNSQVPDLSSADEVIRAKAQENIDSVFTNLEQHTNSLINEKVTAEGILKNIAALPVEEQAQHAQAKKQAEKAIKSLEERIVLADNQLMDLFEQKITLGKNQEVQAGIPQYSEEQAKADIELLNQSNTATTWATEDNEGNTLSIPVTVIGSPVATRDGYETVEVKYTDSTGKERTTYAPTSELVQDTATQQEAAQRITKHFSKLSLDELDTVAKSPYLSEEQRSSLRYLSQAKRAIADLASPTDVTDHIMNGLKGKTPMESHRGLNNYTDMVNTAINTKDEKLLNLALNDLGRFAQDHTDKANALVEAKQLVTSGQFPKVQVLRSNDGTWGIVTDPNKFVDDIKLKATAGWNVTANSNKNGRIDLVTKEATLIQDNLKALTQVGLSFGLQAVEPTVTPPVTVEALREANKPVGTNSVSNNPEQAIVNKLTPKNLFSVTPRQGVPDSKAKLKASIATKFIGFGEGIKNSSTQLYAEQVGKEFANTGNYTPDDVVFVSVAGKRGDAQVRQAQQNKTIDEALKAIKAGAILITDNQAYVNNSSYNEGEKKLAKALKAKGYSYTEHTADGEVLGVWFNKNVPPTTSQTEPIVTVATPSQEVSTPNVIKAWKGVGKSVSKAASSDLGFFATTDKEYASQYAKTGVPEEVEVTLNNPYQMGFNEFREIDRGLSDKSAKEIAQDLKSKGYDGITVTHRNGLLELITFSNSQIIFTKNKDLNASQNKAVPSTQTEPTTAVNTEPQLDTTQAVEATTAEDIINVSDVANTKETQTSDDAEALIEALETEAKKRVTLEDEDTLESEALSELISLAYGNGISTKSLETIKQLFGEDLVNEALRIRSLPLSKRAEAQGYLEQIRLVIASMGTVRAYVEDVTLEDLNTYKELVFNLMQKRKQDTTNASKIFDVLATYVGSNQAVESPVTQDSSPVVDTKSSTLEFDKPVQLSEVFESLLSITSNKFTDEERKYFNQMFKYILSKKPNALVYVVKDPALIKNQVIGAGINKGGWYAVDSEIAYVYPEATEWGTDTLDALSHELIHSITHNNLVNANQEISDSLESLRQYLGTWLMQNNGEISDEVHTRLYYATTKKDSSEMLSVIIGEASVQEKLPIVFSETQLKQLRDIFKILSINTLEQANERNQRRSTGTNQTEDAENVPSNAERGTGTTSRNTSENSGNEITIRDRETISSSETVPESSRSTEGSVTEEVADGRITVLQEVTEEVRQEERSKLMSLRSMVVAYFTQSSVKEEGKGTNPLVAVKDYILQSNLLTQVSNWLSTGYKVSNAQLKQLQHFKEFHKEFRGHILFSLQNREKLRGDNNSDNFVEYLITKDVSSLKDTLDENTLTAISLAAYSYLLQYGTKVTNTDEDIIKLLRLEKDTPIPDVTSNLLRNAGQDAYSVAKELGSSISSSLGLRAMKDASTSMQDRLNTSFGLLTLAALHNSKYMYVSRLSKNDINAITQDLNLSLDPNDFFNPQDSSFVGLNQLTTISANYKINPKTNKIAYKDGKAVLVREKDLEELLTTNKNTKGFLSQLFGVSVGFRLPSIFTPEKFTQKTIPNTNASIPSNQRKQVEAAQKNSNVMRVNTINVFKSLFGLSEDNKYLKELLGIWVDDDVLAQTHISKHESLKAKAENEWRLVNQGLEWAGYLELGNNEYAEFYDTQSVVQNNRMHIDSNLFNQQSSQIHRAMAAKSAFAVTFNVFENQKLLTRFYQGVAEGLEKIERSIKQDILTRNPRYNFFTVDKVPAEDFVPAFEKFLTTSESIAAIDAMIALIQTKTVNTEQQAAIAWFVNKGGMGVQSLQSLIFLAELGIAAQADGMLTTTVSYGSDGINNGVSNANMLLGTASETMRTQTGIISKNSTANNIQDVYAQGISDYYVDFGSYMRDFLDLSIDKAFEKISEIGDKGKRTNKTNKVNALLDLFTTFQVEVEDALGMRKISKVWSIPFNYGAGKVALQRALANGFMKGIYDEMERINNSIIGKPRNSLEYATAIQDRNTLEARLNAVLTDYTFVNNKLIAFKPIKLPLPESLNTFTFQDSVIQSVGTKNDKGDMIFRDITLTGTDATYAIEIVLKTAMTQLHGKAAWKATEAFSKDYMNMYSLYLKAQSTSFELYNFIHSKLVQLKLDAKVRTNKVEGEYIGLTTEELQEIDNIIGNFKPVVNTPISSKATNATQSGIPLADKDKKLEKATPNRVVSSRYPIKGFEGNEKPNMKPALVSNQLTDKGTAGMALPIQGMDALVASAVQAKYPILNIHDQASMPIDLADEIIQYQNEVHLEGLITYHLGLENAKTLVNTFRGVLAFINNDSKVLEDEKANAELLASLTTEFKEKLQPKLAEGEVVQNVKTGEESYSYKGLSLKYPDMALGESTTDLRDAIKTFVITAISNDIKKLNALLETKAIHQYGGEGGALPLTKKHREHIKEQLEYLQRQRVALVEAINSPITKDFTVVAEYQSPLITALESNKGKPITKTDVLDLLTKTTHHKDTDVLNQEQEVLKAIKDLIPDDLTLVYEEDTYEGQGYYNTETKRIHIKAITSEGSYVDTHLLVHELLHSAVAARLQAIKDNPNKYDEARAAVTQLESIRQEVLNLLSIDGLIFTELHEKLNADSVDLAALNNETVVRLQAINKEEESLRKQQKELSARWESSNAKEKAVVREQQAQLKQSIDSLNKEREAKTQTLKDIDAYKKAKNNLRAITIEGFGSALSLAYKLKNLDEFIAYGLSNQKLQAYLKGVQLQQNKRSVPNPTSKWRRFVEAVTKLVGFGGKNASNALTAFAVTTAELFEQLKGVTPANTNQTLNTLRSKYAGTPEWLKAPNGAPSNLNETQWLLVRTDNFKAWFGDWENDPANASKVVDKNGEPLVMYHGTSKDFSEFKASDQANGLLFFTPDVSIANEYAEGKRTGYLGMAEAEVKINIEIAAESNPQNFKGLSITTDTDTETLLSILSDIDTDITSSIEDKLEKGSITTSQAINEFNAFTDTFIEGANVIPVFIVAKNLANTVKTPTEWKQAEKNSAGFYKTKGFDGLYVIESDGVALAVFDTTQIKSATGNNGEFSSTDTRIHYSKYGASDQVNQMSSIKVMQSLPHTGNTDFGLHLNRLAETVIGQLYNSDEVAKAQIDVIQAIQVAPAIKAGFNLSQREAAVQRSLELVLETYTLNTAGGANASQLWKIYKEAQKNIKVENLYDGDWTTATAQERAATHQKFKYLFADNLKGTEALARFVSMALASEEVHSLLGFNTVTAKPSKQKSWFDTVNAWAQYVFAWMGNKLVRTSANDPAYKQLQSLVNNLVALDIRNRQDTVALYEKAWNLVGKVTEPLDKAAQSLRQYATNRDFLRNSKYLPLRTLGSIAALDAKAMGEIIPKLIRETRDKARPNEKLGEAMNALMESTAMTQVRKAMEALIRQANLNAKERQDRTDNVKKAIMSWFKDSGKHITKEIHKAITYTLLRTDAQSLLTTFGLDKTIGLLLDTAKLKNEIDLVIKDISQYPNGVDMIHAAEELGYYMISNKGGLGLSKNATAIAVGLGTPYQIDLEDVDQALVGQLDVLISLFAMKYTAAKDRKVLGDMYKENPNALEGLLQMHKGFMTDAATEFKDNPLNYIKGWMPEIVNPYREIKVANGTAQKEQMLKEGWKLIEEIKPHGKFLMVHPDIGYQRLVSGAVDLQNSHRKGTEIIDRQSKQYLNTVKANLAYTKHRASIPLGQFDPTKRETGLIPAYDTDGVPMGFNYEMASWVRDKEMERNNNFADLMGAYAGAMFYKPAKRNQSVTVANVLFEDYKQNYQKNPNSYIKLSGKSSDPKIVEMWRMLPKDFRQRATELYGKGEPIIINNEAFLLAFGFKKWTITSIWDKPADQRTKIETMFVTMAESLLGVSAKAHIAKAGHIWTEAVSKAKDFIVIRSISVLWHNVLSNGLMLMAYGINPVTILKEWTLITANVRSYQKLHSELIQLKANTLAGKGNDATERQINAIQKQLEANPMNKYINEGLLSSIVEDVTIQQGDYSYDSELKKKIDGVTGWLPDSVKTIGAWAVLNPSTQGYQFLATTTQLSDFVAKVTLAKHLESKGMDFKAAVSEASQTFINYDVPQGVGMQYMNDMGLFMFTKFFLRIQAVLLKLMDKKAATVLAQHIAVEGLTDMQGILDPMALTRVGDWPFEEGAFSIVGASMSIAPINVAF